jgi:hypothetical protein
MKLRVAFDNGGGDGAPTFSIMSLGHDTYNLILNRGSVMLLSVANDAKT